MSLACLSTAVMLFTHATPVWCSMDASEPNSACFFGWSLAIVVPCFVWLSAERRSYMQLSMSFRVMKD